MIHFQGKVDVLSERTGVLRKRGPADRRCVREMNMDTRTVDLEGLPEPIARGLEVVAQMARKLARQPESTTDTASELPLWSLGAIGGLSREAIYDDYQCRC